jgi:hypothetical protein
VVGEGGVVVAPVERAGIDVHGGVDQPGDVVQEPVMGVDGDRARVDEAQPRVDDDARLGRPDE